MEALDLGDRSPGEKLIFFACTNIFCCARENKYNITIERSLVSPNAKQQRAHCDETKRKAEMKFLQMNKIKKNKK